MWTEMSSRTLPVAVSVTWKVMMLETLLVAKLDILMVATSKIHQAAGSATLTAADQTPMREQRYYCCCNFFESQSITPFAFTQEGVAMLSSVLRSTIAIQVNIRIMRAFTIIRQYALGYAELNKKLEDFMVETNMQFSEVYQALIELAEQKRIAEKPQRRIGFQTATWVAENSETS